jgi:glutamate formiminotransferase/formiminotetrahydrofolate cyclodeaminase
MEAFSLPKKSDEEKSLREEAVQKATKNACLVPLKVMETALSGFDLINEMVEKGNQNSISDVGVGALALRSCVKGAYLNVKINASGLTDIEFAKGIIARGAELEHKAEEAEGILLNIINSKIGKG